MVFSSAVFLFIFLPIVLFMHTVIKNNNIRNGLLIIASLVFYAYGEPVYVLLLLASVFVNYLFGRALARHKSRILLAISVILNLSLLVLFKYCTFLPLVMPIGISFFTFQAISYVIDTYRSEDNETVGFLDVLLYISLFPQLIAGPIVKFNTIKDQIAKREVTTDKMAAGIRRFVIGLSKKMLLANAAGLVADKVFTMNTASIDMPLAWVGAICYTLQIYFDFSGYSDMALGLGKAMGFDFPENFNYPYAASGIRDFWRRWHMSLTGWFREYLYIPLGGNRKGKARQMLNSMIVFICTGIWHGANWTFVFWGFYHGVLMSVETAATKKHKEIKFNPFKWVYTILFVIIGFVIFRADNLSYAFSYIGRMFSFTRLSGAGAVLLSVMTPSAIIALIVSVLASIPVIPYIKGRITGKKAYPAVSGICYALTFVLYLLCIMTLAVDSYNPFIYFRF